MRNNRRIPELTRSLVQGQVWRRHNGCRWKASVTICVPCSRCNISLVSSRERNFLLAPRRARCKLVKARGWAFSKQSILRNPGAARRARMLCGIFSVIPLQRSGCREAKDQLTMRSLLILAAICFSATAFAQSAPPKLGGKPLVQVKPKEPMGCKLVGTVRGTKLWAGDCVGSELRGSATTTEPQALPEQQTGAITPAQKE